MNDKHHVALYISSRFSARERLRGVRDQLHVMGYTVTARWLDEGNRPYEVLDDTARRSLALRDVVDIRRAAVFIRDTTEVGRNHACEVEMGMALAQGVPVFLVGPPRNIFHFLAVRQFESWDDALAYFKGWAEC